MSNMWPEFATSTASWWTRSPFWKPLLRKPRKKSSQTLFSAVTKKPSNFSAAFTIAWIQANSIRRPLKNYRIYRLNYSRLQSLNGEMKRTFRNLKDLLSLPRGNQDQPLEELIRAEFPRFCVQTQEEGALRVIFTPAPPRNTIHQCEPLSLDTVFEVLQGVTEEDVWLDGVIPSRTIDLLESQLQRDLRQRGSKEKI